MDRKEDVSPTGEEMEAAMKWLDRMERMDASPAPPYNNARAVKAMLASSCERGRREMREEAAKVAEAVANKWPHSAFDVAPAIRALKVEP